MITGTYVDTFAEATHAMLNNVSTNAPYPFLWLKIERVEVEHIVCTARGEEHRLPYRSTGAGDMSSIVMQDPIFGPTRYPVVPFKGEEQ